MICIQNFRLVIAILLLFTSACSTPPKSSPESGDVVADFPDMTVGDSWIVTDGHPRYGTATFTYKVTSVEPDGSFDLREENNKGDQAVFRHFDSTATGVSMIMESHFDPEALQFPLFVGKAWSTEAMATSLSGKRRAYKSEYFVAEYTDIEVGPGTFKAFRIRQTLRGSNNWTGHYDHWYAPAAKAVVKSSPSHTRGAKLIELKLLQ